MFFKKKRVIKSDSSAADIFPKTGEKLTRAFIKKRLVECLVKEPKAPKTGETTVEHTRKAQKKIKLDGKRL